MERDTPDSDGPADADEENRRYRRLQAIVALATAQLSQDPGLTPGEGIGLILWAREQAVELFPGKGDTFDLIYRPRLVRILQERFGGSRSSGNGRPAGGEPGA